MKAYEVAVIGLGAMGSAALFHLARQGLSVIGIERFEMGHDRGSSHGDSRAIRLGYSEHPSYVPLASSRFEVRHIQERLTSAGVLTTTGILEAGHPGSAMLAGSLAACREHDLEFELLDAAEIMRRFPVFDLPESFGGVWQPEGGYVRPDLANRLHVDLARGLKADVRFNTPVTAIETSSAGVRLIVGDDVIEAASVIVCTGAWMSDLIPALKSRLTVQRQALCWYEAKGPSLVAPGALPVFMIDGKDDLIYGFPDFSGAGMKCASHYASGLLAHADDARQDAGAVDELRTRRFLEQYMPMAAGPLKDMKTCLYTMTPDEDFVIDQLPSDPRIVVCSACSGHGFKFASVIGEVLADLATRGETRHDISRFAISRFVLN